ncbi:hypothetical protein EPUL_006468, partial [Erysiphe pulchra]
MTLWISPKRLKLLQRIGAINLPPFPPFLQFPIPPSPTEPLTPPSNSAMSNTIIDGRQILKPVAPSKRPITERPTSDSSDKSDSRNAFFPKELADIIAIRQRRE